MPTEVAGWLIRELDIPTGGWVLLLSRETTLAVGLCMRGPIGINVTVGLMQHDVSAIEEIKSLVPAVTAAVKQHARLHRIRWKGHTACVRRIGGRAHSQSMISFSHSRVVPMHTPPPVDWMPSIRAKQYDLGSSVISALVQHHPLNVSGRQSKKELKAEMRAAESSSSSSDTSSSSDGSSEAKRPPRKQAKVKAKASAKPKPEAVGSSPASSARRPPKTSKAPSSREPSTEQEEPKAKKVKKGSLAKLQDALGPPK